MNESERIGKQIDQAFVGEAWHGDPVLDVLDGVDSITAAARPLESGHTIWEIVKHLMATQRVIESRLDGSPIELSAAEDWPKIEETTDVAWTEDIKALVETNERIRDRVTAYDVRRLDEPMVEGHTSAYNNFQGYVQHTIYHVAQIGMLKRMLSEQRNAVSD